MLKAFLERRRIEKTLARFVSPEAARELASGAVDTPPLVQREIEFAFIRLSAATAQSYSDSAAVVADLALRHGGVVHSLLPLVIVGFGVIEHFAPGDRLAFIAELTADAAVVHGRVTAAVGLFGSASRLEHGFWWRDMSNALQRLDTLAAGEKHEFASHQSI